MPTGRSTGRWKVAAALFGAGVIACAALVVASAAGPKDPKEPPPSGRGGPPDIATAQVLDFDVTTVATGELKAKNQIELRNRMEFEAAIVEIIPEGTRVTKGEVVARLNADPIQQQIDEQMIQLEQAKNDVTAAESVFAITQSECAAAERKAILALELAELECKKWLQGEVESKRLQLAIALDEAKSELTRTEVKAERSRKLHEQGFTSADELQKDELAARKQKAALETAELNKKVYESFEFPRDQRQKQSAVDEARSELERIKQKNTSELASKDSHRGATRQQLGLRENRLAKLREQLDMATLRAPADGLVVYGSTLDRRMWGGDQGPFQIGRKLWPNQLVIALPDTSQMTGVVRVHESIAGRIKPGQTATLRIDAIGGKVVTGKVLSIGLLAEGENWMDPNIREFRVTIELGDDSKGLEIRPSMRCEATVLLDKVAGAVAVPIEAVMSEGAVRYVCVPDGGRYIRKPVKVGRRSDRFAEISAGVASGDRVLLRTPETRELVVRPWDEAQLSDAGLARNDKGEIVSKEPIVEAVAPVAKP